MGSLHVGVVGATGLVGEVLLRALEKRKLPIGSLSLFASGRSEGRKLAFQGEELPVAETRAEAFEKLDLALFASTDAGAKEFAPQAVERGCVVIDNGSTFRLDPKVPLVVPEVNGEALLSHRGIIANPNCSTIQMVMVLKPLIDAFGIEEVFCSTYQSVSGWGKRALVLFNAQERAEVSGEPLPEDPEIFPRPIVGNVLPHIDAFLEGGETKEEAKMRQETEKILGREVPVYPFCVRVPVRVGHAEVLFVRLQKEAGSEEIREVLRAFPGVVVQDDPDKQDYPTPRDVAGEESVFVGRVRQLSPRLFSLFVVADNLRKGAATNALQIAEALLEKNCLKVPIPQ